MQYTYPFSNTLTETGTVTRTKPIAFLYDCVDDPFAPCCDCFPEDGQIMYFIAGDTFTYQLPFTPDSLTVYNFDGTVIGDFNSWIGPNLITVNVDDLDPSIDCFYFSVLTRGVRKCFDFGLRRHLVGLNNPCIRRRDCGIGTITIESDYSAKDCHGNRYDNGYSNMRRFLADVEWVSSSEDAKLIDNIRVSTKIYNHFQIKILQPLKQSSKLLKELTEVIMRGKYLRIEIATGDPYEILYCEDYTDNLNRSYDTSLDWYPVFTVRTLKCEGTGNCN
jgi:hypothetical protein